MPQGKLTTVAGLAAGLREVWSNVDSLAGDLDGAGWAAPTGCPGWSVGDCVAHLAAVESGLLGRPAPEHRLPEGLAGGRSDFARRMETGVDLRRSRAMAEVLAEYREVTAARLRAVAALDETALDAEVPGPLGPMPLRLMLDIRVFDSWTNEQDIRRALGRPGGIDGPAGAHGRERLCAGVAARLQERLGPPAGTAVVLDVTGPGGARRRLEFDGARGRVLDGGPPEATAVLRLDLPTLTVLGCGRCDDPGARDRVAVEGDAALAARILEDMAFTP